MPTLERASPLLATARVRKLKRKRLLPPAHRNRTNHHGRTILPPHFHHDFRAKKFTPHAPKPLRNPPKPGSNPRKTENQPQLTTKPEDRFYPQPTGPATAIDFSFSASRPHSVRQESRQRAQLKPDNTPKREKPHPREDGASNNMPAIT